MRDGLPTRLAVTAGGIADTAGVVTSAAAVMVSVFAIFATLSMLEMKMLGVGLSAAILLDATLIRLVMLPSILVLLGETAWWPTARPARSVSRCSRRSLPTSSRVAEGDPGPDGPPVPSGPQAIWVARPSYPTLLCQSPRRPKWAREPGQT